jgi:hypothetical protein
MTQNRTSDGRTIVYLLEMNVLKDVESILGQGALRQL